MCAVAEQCHEIETVCCATFLVSRKKVLSRPKKVYELMMAYNIKVRLRGFACCITWFAVGVSANDLTITWRWAYLHLACLLITKNSTGMCTGICLLVIIFLLWQVSPGYAMEWSWHGLFGESWKNEEPVNTVGSVFTLSRLVCVWLCLWTLLSLIVLLYVVLIYRTRTVCVPGTRMHVLTA